jgi:penicillin-binding protein 1A
VPIADKTSVGVKDGNAVISTEIGGTKIDLKLPIGDRTPVTPPPQ